jgi:energy-coupling factor transporter ATP-binding protein EcfA2
MKLKMCEVILYDNNYKTLSEVVETCKKYRSIKKYAMIIHDKDVMEDGITPKKWHIHLYLHFGSAYNTEQLIKAFGILDNQIERIKGRWANVLEYMTHEHDPKKHHYDTKECVSNFSIQEDIEKEKQATTRAKAIENAIDDYMTLHSVMEDLLKFLTTSEVKEHWSEIEKAKRIRAEYLRGMSNEKERMTIYIHGMAGSGKSTTAKTIAGLLGWGTFVTSIGKDFIDGYDGEPVIIVEEFNDKNIPFETLLGLCDPHHGKTLQARYHNINVAPARLVIIVTTKPLDEIYTDVYGSEREQLTRRINAIVEIEEGTSTWYVGNKEGYAIAITLEELIQIGQDKKIAFDRCDEVGSGLGRQILQRLNAAKRIIRGQDTLQIIEKNVSVGEVEQEQEPPSEEDEGGKYGFA